MDQKQPVEPKPDMSSLADKAAQAAINASQPNVEADGGDTAKESEAAQQVVDLDSLGEFFFQGKKYTPDDLRHEIMMRKDYTKKTQELAQYKKYDENLKFDLQTVRQNPNLADAFKQTYPEKYHNLLDVVLKHDEDERDAGRQNSEYSLDDLPKPLIDRLKATEDKLEEYNRMFFEQKVKANQDIVEGWFSRYSDKYPYANEDTVMNRAQSLLQQNKDSEGFEMTETIIERLFKTSHQEQEKRYSELYNKRVDEQLKKGEKAKDSGPGGLAPGRERKKIALSDVADIIIQDLQGR